MVINQMFYEQSCLVLPAVYKVESTHTEPTSDNLTPQETTNQDAPETGADGDD
jgi:hypothetical protein